MVELARERARRRRRRGHGAVARERRGGGVSGLRLRAARRDLVRPVEVRVPEPSELVGREVDGVETAAGRLRRGLVCVFDTGLTGCVMSDALCAELGLRADPSGRIAASRLDLALTSSHKITIY